ncbi:shikimate kinase [Novosphingobium aquimarinum]|uniref:shikimate kinase n=1 Tax=Novosphingobium aquimarinum TaxID=2682494 RepID=UPI0012EC5F27|nr:shikimate kinase [Novosphingobium aquimarinum]
MDLRPAPASTAHAADIARRLDRPIVLVGMMGVGKSSVGKRLAALLDRQFVDSDDEIEASAQMSIPEIFEMFGEDYFRDGERRVIARLLQESSSCVIATGGGAFCNPQTRKLILEKALTIWLDSDVDTLVERTARKDNRPLLKQGDPRQILAELREQRIPAYSEAPIHVTSSSGPHSLTITKILDGLDKWL